MKRARQTARGRKVSEAMKLYWKKRKRAEATLKRKAKSGKLGDRGELPRRQSFAATIRAAGPPK